MANFVIREGVCVDGAEIQTDMNFLRHRSSLDCRYLFLWFITNRWRQISLITRSKVTFILVSCSICEIRHSMSLLQNLRLLQFFGVSKIERLQPAWNLQRVTSPIQNLSEAPWKFILWRRRAVLGHVSLNPESRIINSLEKCDFVAESQILKSDSMLFLSRYTPQIMSQHK